MSIYLIRLRIHVDKVSLQVACRWTEERVVGGQHRVHKMEQDFADYSAAGAYFDARFA